MNKETQRAIAAKGGRTAQAKGVARNWNSEEARLTGQKVVVPLGSSVCYNNRFRGTR